jgi:uncharacterized protein YjbI with pentapeptide repeats
MLRLDELIIDYNLYFMKSSDLKKILASKKAPKKTIDLVSNLCLDGGNLDSVFFHELTYERMSFFNLKIINSDISKAKFYNCTFNNVIFTGGEIFASFSGCLFINCSFAEQKFAMLTCQNCQFISTHFGMIEKLILNTYDTKFIQCEFYKAIITKSEIKSSTFIKSKFIELQIKNSPFQSNYMLENVFFKVKNIKANNYLATFYKNEYHNTTGFEKDLLFNEEQGYYIKQGESVDTLQESVVQQYLESLIKQKGKK